MSNQPYDYYDRQYHRDRYPAQAGGRSPYEQNDYGRRSGYYQPPGHRYYGDEEYAGRSYNEPEYRETWQNSRGYGYPQGRYQGPPPSQPNRYREQHPQYDGYYGRQPQNYDDYRGQDPEYGRRQEQNARHDRYDGPEVRDDHYPQDAQTHGDHGEYVPGWKCEPESASQPPLEPEKNPQVPSGPKPADDIGPPKWPMKAVQAPSSSSSMSMAAALEKNPIPPNWWLRLAITEDKVFTSMDIPASARLCKFYYLEKNSKGCTNKGCKYGHNPYTFNCVQLALMPNLKIFDRLVRISNVRETAQQLALPLSEHAIVQHAEELRERHKLFKSAGVLTHAQYADIDWWCAPRPRPNRDSEGQGQSVKPASQGPTGKNNERGTLVLSHPRNGKGKDQSSAIPTAEFPNNADPDEVFRKSILGCGAAVRKYLASRIEDFCDLKEKGTVDHAIKAVQNIHAVLLDLQHPMRREAMKLWSELRATRDNMIALGFLEENDIQVNSVLNETYLTQGLEELIAKFQRASTEDSDVVAEEINTADESKDDEPVAEPSIAPLASDRAQKKQEKKQRKTEARLLGVPKEPTVAPRKFASQSVLPRDSNAFDIYGDSPIVDAATAPADNSLAALFKDPPHEVSEETKDPSFITVKKKKSLKTVLKRLTPSMSKASKTQGYTEEQRAAMRARDAAADGPSS